MAKTMSRDEKAMVRVKAELEAGATLTVHAASGYYTAGAFTPAVGPRGFAVYGYGPGAVPAREFAESDASFRAAWAIVTSCGSTRAREAAQASEKARRVMP